MKKTLTALLFIFGCYRSHEVSEGSICENLSDCPSGQYCDSRFFCLPDEFGGFNCDPFRAGYGCTIIDGKIICDDLSRSTGYGLCITRETCENTFESSRYPCSQIEVN